MASDVMVKRRQRSRANLNCYLKSARVELDALLSALGEVGAQECAIVAGSVSDGFANEESDIDIILIGNRAFSDGSKFVVAQSSHEHATWDIGEGKDVQLAIYSLSVVRSLGGKVSASLAKTGDRCGEGLYVCSYDEMKLLHRIATGCPIANPGVADALYEEMNLDALSGYLMILNLNNYMALREDVIGQCEEGRVTDALWIAAIMCRALLCATNAALGETNMMEKWQWRLLQSHRDQVGDDLLEKFWRFCYLADRNSPIACVGESLDFADRIVKQVCRMRPEAYPAFKYLKDKVNYRVDRPRIRNDGRVVG